MATPTTLPKTKITQIAKDVQSDFDPNDITSKGHTKFVSFDTNGVQLAWKEGKPLMVKLAKAKLPITEIDVNEMRRVIEQFDNLTALGKGFPNIVVKTKTKKNNRSY